MHELHIDKHSLADRKYLARDVAYHIYLMCISGNHGSIIIAAEHPESLCRATASEWSKLIEEIRNEYVSTIDEARKNKLKDRITWMCNLSFIVGASEDASNRGITFATAEDLVRMPPSCITLYITYEFPKAMLHMLTSWMPPRSSVIIYEVTSPAEASS